MFKFGLCELELLRDELDILKAALRYRSQEASRKRNEQLADRLGPIGLYQFNIHDLSFFYVALTEFSVMAESIGHEIIALRCKQLAEIIQVKWMTLDALFEDAREAARDILQRLPQSITSSETLSLMLSHVFERQSELDPLRPP
ncbi:hypothetical protein [Paenibacillus sp. NPDC057967]|uniref:hypothetical protein n=1 Tax=Paenibacillus sp. NPDC057967 TaxID=3346293 RepID=UPI0036DE47A1